MAVGFLLVPDARSRLGPYLALFLAGSALSLLAARSLSASGPGFILACGTLFRLTLLFRPADLSDDIFRYLWDGRVARAALSPYAYAPNDPALATISPSLRDRLAHRDIRGVYPPVAQAVFRHLGTEANAMPLKAFFAAADLSVVALIAASGVPGAAFGAALYAFHPLPITETAGQGHLDTLGVALLLCAMAFLARGGRVVSGAALASSVLTKYVPLAALLVFVRRGRWRLAFGFALTVAALWLAASRGGTSPAGGVGQYATRWNFNSPAYMSAVGLMEASRASDRAKAAFLDWKEKHGHPDWTLRVFPLFYSAFFARVLLGALLFAALIVIAVRVRDFEAAVFASLAALLLLSPTIHPWYVLWVLPFAVKKREPAFLFLSFAVPLSYALLYPVPGVSGQLVLAAEFGPFVLLLAWSLLRTRPAMV